MSWSQEPPYKPEHRIGISDGLGQWLEAGVELIPLEGQKSGVKRQRRRLSIQRRAQLNRVSKALPICRRKASIRPAGIRVLRGDLCTAIHGLGSH